MKRRLVAVTCLILFLCGCEGSRKELETQINDLQGQLEQQEVQLERYKNLGVEVEKLKKVTQTISVSSLQVLERLDKLDRDLYNGMHLESLRSKQGKTHEIVAGYIALIDNVERDLGDQSKRPMD